MKPLDTLARPGVFATLRTLDNAASGTLATDDCFNLLQEGGVSDPVSTVGELEGLGLIHARADSLSLSTNGLKTVLLLRALSGASLHEILPRLRALAGNRDNYTLVREGMTTGFFRSLATNPNVGRLYVCSPWIRLSTKEQRYLASNVLRNRRLSQPPRITVITRVGDKYGSRRESLDPFLDLGATVFSNHKLHAKVYIREPGMSGGYTMAIIGSQNLTRSKYLELGIRIEGDTVIIRKLVTYVLELTYESDLFFSSKGSQHDVQC